MTNEVFEKTLFDLKETICQTMGTPVNKAGWPFIIGFAIVSVALAMISATLGWIGLILTMWCLYFFRDPIRAVPLQKGLILSPGDGRVTAVTEGVSLPRELRAVTVPSMTSDVDPLVDEDAGEFTRVSVFLSVFDVHVNRIPVDGTIRRIVYKPGLFLNAGNERASMENERCAILLDTTTDDKTIAFVQIAGLIARRIICDAKEGDAVHAGERYGLIRFGSRMDVYLPKDVAVQVAVGQRVLGGETIIADLNVNGPFREVQPI